MTVYVYAPAALTQGSVSDGGRMELPEGTTLRNAVKRLKIPLLLRPFPLFTVNHRPARPDHELEDGDVIGFIIPLGGG